MLCRNSPVTITCVSLFSAFKKAFHTLRTGEHDPGISPQIGRHILQKDLSTITRLLKQPFRNDEDWDAIQDILLEHDIFTAAPAWNTKTVRNVGEILCRNEELFVFTTFEKCANYMKKLIEKGECPSYYQVSAMPYQYVMEVARKEHMPAYLDYPHRRRKKFIVYDSEKNKIMAFMLA